MTRGAALLSGVAAGVAAVGFVGCKSIRSAPAGTPRLEVEVVYEVEQAFYGPFAEGVDRERVAAALREAVAPIADIGLRFYPVPSERYAQDEERPDYVMTVRALRFEPDRALNLDRDGEQEDRPATIRARLDRVSCLLEARIHKRRESGPPLDVGRAKSTGWASPSAEDAGTKLELRKHSNEVNVTAVPETMLQRAFVDAAKQAFYRLQEAIDRELALLAAGPQR